MSYEDDMIRQLLHESEAAIMQDRELDVAYLKGLPHQLSPAAIQPNPYIRDVIKKFREDAEHAYGIGGADGTTETPSTDEPTGEHPDAEPRQQEVGDGKKQTS